MTTVKRPGRQVAAKVFRSVRVVPKIVAPFRPKTVYKGGRK